MKRGTPEHPKTARLARLLARPKYQVVGVLESVWHFTQRYAPRGDVGKWSDEEIAASIQWEADPGELIDALVESGFLKRCDEHFRIYVHDWPEHADQTVQRCAEVRNYGFLSIYSVHKVPQNEGAKLEKKRKKEEQASNTLAIDSKKLDSQGQGPGLVSSIRIEKDSLVSSSLVSRNSKGAAGGTSSEVSARRKSKGVFFLTKGPGEFFADDCFLDEYMEIFPRLDVKGEIKKAAAWCEANPGRRKTIKGMKRFLSGWLLKADMEVGKQNAKKRGGVAQLIEELSDEGEKA